MRLGHVIGTVTLSHQEPSYRTGRFLVVQPFSAAQYAERASRRSGSASPIPFKLQGAAPTLVVYDRLGAGVGHVVGFTEGSEAAKPFDTPTPVDAYCAAIVDEIFYQPPA